MSKNSKKIIAIIVSITLIFGYENLSVFRSALKHIGNVIVTMAGEINNEKNSDVDQELEESSENFAIEDESALPETVCSQTEAPDMIYDVEKETLPLESDSFEAESTDNSTDKLFETTSTDVVEETEDETMSVEVVSNSFAYATGEIIEEEVELIKDKNTVVQVSKAENFVKGGVYHIVTYDDWDKFIELSKISTLEKMTFVIYRRENKYDDWTLTNKTIGSQEYPFSGTLYQLNSSSVITTNTVLFEYLSSKAIIGEKKSKDRTVTFKYTQPVNAGLATNLIIDKGTTVKIGSPNDSNYYVKVIGKIQSTSNPVGGLFSNVYVNSNSTVAEGQDEKCTIDLYGGTNINFTVLTDVMYGTSAGGLVGNIYGNIQVNVNGIPNSSMDIKAYAASNTDGAGGLFGKVGQGVFIDFVNTTPITLNNNVYYYDTSRGYCSGALIGYMSDSKLQCSTTGGIVKAKNVSAVKYAGGLVGYAHNSTVVISNFTQKNNTYIYQSAKGGAASNFCVGGVIGKYYSDISEDYTGQRPKLELSYIKSENKTASTNSNIKITTANDKNNKRGGIVGVVDAGDAEVYIHHINTDASESGVSGDNSYYVSLVFYENGSEYKANTETGGIAGVLAGTNIKIENVKFNYVYISGNDGKNSNSIGGDVVGNVSARTGLVDNVNKNTKIIIKDIEVLNNYIQYANSYHGGLFGIVSNSAIAMQGTINLEKVPYKAYSNSQRYANEIVLLATQECRGFVAGYEKQSVIFVDTNCNFIRPITYNDDGTIAEYNSDGISYTDWWGASSNTILRYCMDDIGNAGSVFNNVEGVFDITKKYAEVITGTVDKDTEGYYRIDTPGDAIRLAVIGNSVNSSGYPQFGGNCFRDSEGNIQLLSTIFSCNFHLSTDLDMRTLGIHGFAYNANISYAFTGKFEGVQNNGKNPKITLNFISRQKYGGLFTNVKDATFSNMDIDGFLHYLLAEGYNTPNSNRIRAAAGSIAAYASGSINVDNVNISTSIKTGQYNYTTWDNSYMYCYGGMFGEYYPATTTATFTCTNSNISPKFTNVRSNTFVGGMIAWMLVNKNSIVTSMNISDCEIGTDIIPGTIFGYGSTNNNVHGRLSGFIGLISGDYNNVGSTGGKDVKASSIGDATYATITMNNIVADGCNIDMSNVNANYVRTEGGILGYSWSYVDVDINGFTVRNSSLNSRGVIGGLISFVNGRVNLNSISIESLVMNDNKQGNVYATYCGLLIGNGQNAITTISNYNIATNGNVVVNGYSNFDEIVGMSVRIASIDANGNYIEYIYNPGEAVEKSYKYGGIVNIIDNNFNSFTDNTSSYRSYENKIVSNTNKYTRYYYNLFTGNKDDWVITDGNIQNEEQFMTFAVANYSNYSTQTYSRFLKEYFSNKTIPSAYTVSNNLNLNGYSYYPAPIRKTTINFNNHTVTLYGQEISKLENDLYSNSNNLVNRDNEISDSQHYLMHASLFNSVEGNTEIRNVTLTGTAANIGSNSGVLVSMYAINNLTVENIVLNNIKIADYSGTEAALMLAHVGVQAYDKPVDTNLTVDGITTSGYNGNSPVASALIGYVGNTQAIKTVVSFRNMRLEDEKLADKSAGKVFKYASFIYNFSFTSDLTKNNSFVSYTFTKADCDSDNITFGDEIKNGVHYMDQDRGGADDKLTIAINAAKTGTYIPYIYMERNIYVNPRNGNITQGCGTYEDPYIITTKKQFLTLYLYLTGKTEYDVVFKGTGTNDDVSGAWKVVAVGGSTANHNECSMKNGTDTQHTPISYNDLENFPTRDDLRTAYYKISANIFLGETTGNEDMNDANIAGEFYGLGCEKYPFAGVIVGKKSETENYKITLPKQGTKNLTDRTEQLEQSTFGLIQCMAGAVVKDLDIENEDNISNAYYNVTEAGGGVAAKILGGDNIIDNVNVKLNFSTDKVSEANSTVVGLGGYVGVIENGSLIFRNIKGKSSTSTCRFELKNQFTSNVLSTRALVKLAANNIGKTINDSTIGYVQLRNYLSSASYVDGSPYNGEYGERVGLFVGMVRDGYVVYEGYTDTNPSIKPFTLEKNEMGLGSVYGSTYPLINGFHMINGSVLNENTSGTTEDNKKITVTADASGKNYTVDICNVHSLELMTIALNSDSLSVYYCQNDNHSTGYGYKNRCRKASYDYVGSNTAVTSEDRNFAKAYDDNKTSGFEGYLYPYVCYKYFDYTKLTNTTGVDYNATDYVEKNFIAYKNTLSNITVSEKINNVMSDYSCLVSNMNKTDEKVANYESTYVLKKNSDNSSKLYDLSQYDLSFKGIGGIYTVDYSDFRANFNGNNNEIKFYISRASDPEVLYSGLFNRLFYSQKLLSDEYYSADQLVISNFTVKNSIVYNPNKFSEIDKDSSYNYLVAKGIKTCSTGGITGVMQGAWKLENITWSRDEAITDNVITSDVSGYKSVGGLVGRINDILPLDGYYTVDWYNNNSGKLNDIDFINCNLVGTSNNKIKITELGSEKYTSYANYMFVSVGGMIGGIGTNLYGLHYSTNYGDININICDLSNVDILLQNKGYGGGISGQVGNRYNTYSEHDTQRSSIGNVIVDGKNVNNDNISSFTNVTIRSNNTIDDYSLGGMFGHIESPRSKKVVGGNIIISNYNMSNICVDDTKAAYKDHNNSGYEATGGIIGYSRSYLVDISSINFSGTNNIGNQYCQKSVGGVIGKLSNVAKYYSGSSNDFFREEHIGNIKGCSLSGMHIKNYNRNSVGGYIGLTFIEQVNIGSDDTTDIIENSEIISEKGENAGGVIGYIYADNSTKFTCWTKANFKNIDVKNTNVIVKGSGASGGVVGRAYYVTSDTTNMNFSNVNVYSDSNQTPLISAKDYAGGLLGAINVTNTDYSHISVNTDGYIGIGQKYDAANHQWNNDTNSGLNITGKYSGGIIGKEYNKVNDNYAADIMVANNRIYSYDRDNKTSVYSGGIFGQLEKSGNSSSTFNKVTVKNNMIFTGRNKTDYSSVACTTGDIAAGGLFGYLINNEKTNVYMPKVTLSNNSIGYYDVGKDYRNNVLSETNEATNFTGVALNSKDVKILNSVGTKYQTVSWDEIDTLNDTNIGNYSVAFGKFIGKHSQTYQSGQIFIMVDSVEYDKDKVGSIPVIDVGMNVASDTIVQNTVTYQEGNPYMYKKYCHILYRDDISSTSYTDIDTANDSRYPKSIDSNLLVSGDDDYNFGMLKNIVENYRTLNNNVADIKLKNYNYIMSKRLNMYITYSDNTNYSLCGTDNNYYDATYNIIENGVEANKYNGVPVLVIDGQQPQSVGNYVAAILTNGGGVISDNAIKELNDASVNSMNSFWNITCKNAYIDVDGSIHEIDPSDDKFVEHQSSSVVCTNSNRLSRAESLYDQYIEVDGGKKIYTITLLCYTYSCPVATSDGIAVNNIKTFYIPIFAKEKVTVDSYLRILSDEEYSITNAMNNGYKNEVTVSHDSTYTLYSEFVYDSIRNNKAFMNDKLDKFICTRTESGLNAFTVGTNMTLIDYQTGLAYYYTVDESSYLNRIPFEAFVDKEGNNYEQRNISSGISSELSFNYYKSVLSKDDKTNFEEYKDTRNLKGIGVERYFIVVEPPEVENDVVFDIKIDTEAKDGTGVAVDEFFNKDTKGDSSSINIVCLPGPVVRLGGVDSNGKGTDGVTFVKGKISAKEEVKIDTNIEFVVSDYDSDTPSTYWANKFVNETIDSANTNKYLEATITLLNSEGQVVPWPAGTNISVNGGPKKILVNNMVINEYKDYAEAFALQTVNKDIFGTCYLYHINEGVDDETGEDDRRWIYYDEDVDDYFYYNSYDPVTADWEKIYLNREIKDEYIAISNQMNISLDFSAADIDDYNGTFYTVMVKLYRSDDPGFLNEESTDSLRGSIRQYSNSVFVESAKDLAVAVAVENLLDLGINLYKNVKESYLIPFTNKFDFSELIHSKRATEDIALWSNKNYMATYRIYKKVEKNDNNEVNKGLGYNDNIGNIIPCADNYEYQIVNWNDSPFELIDSEGNPYNSENITVNSDEEQNVIRTSLSFSDSEIDNGTKNIKYVTERDMTLKVKTAYISDEDLTNYKVTVTYVPYNKDEPIPMNDQNQKWMDYFVFTIAKLKTDF